MELREERGKEDFSSGDCVLVNFYERFYADEIVFPEIEKSLSFRRSKALDGKMSLY